jgi:hypothetical protein
MGKKRTVAKTVKTKKRSENDIVFHEPVVCFLDIECSSSTGTYWGQPYQTRIIEEVETWHILSIAYQFEGSRKVIVKALPDYKTYETDQNDDRELVLDIWENILSKCDVVVAHNAKFDVGHILSRCVVHGLKPSSPFISYCTLRATKRVFGFSDNRLATLAVYLDLPRKLESGGSDTWMTIRNGNEKDKKAAWARLRKYNVGVITLRALYTRVAPYDQQHFKRSYFNHSETCDVCGSKDLQSRGWKKNKRTPIRKLRCRPCGHWQLSNTSVKIVEE